MQRAAGQALALGEAFGKHRRVEAARHKGALDLAGNGAGILARGNLDIDAVACHRHAAQPAQRRLTADERRLDQVGVLGQHADHLYAVSALHAVGAVGHQFQVEFGEFVAQRDLAQP